MRFAYARAIAGLAGLTLLAACGSGEKETASASGVPPLPSSGLTAQLASYDLAVGFDRSVSFGLLGESDPHQGNSPRLVNFGTATVQFDFLGDGSSVRPGPKSEATWFPVPGQKIANRPAKHCPGHLLCRSSARSLSAPVSRLPIAVTTNRPLDMAVLTSCPLWRRGFISIQ